MSLADISKCLLKKKKIHTALRLRIIFIRWNLWRTLAQDTVSPIALRDCSKKIIREEPGYIGVFVERKNITKHLLNIRRLLLIRKTKHFKLLISVLFHLWEDARVLAHWSRFLWCNSLGRVPFFSVLNPLRQHSQQEQLQRLMAPLLIEMASDILCSHRIEE